MRIVFVSYEFPPQFGGGIGTYVAAMSRSLAARGHAVTVITVSDRRYPSRELVDAVEVVRLPLAVATGPEPMATLRCWQARSDAVAELLFKMTRSDAIDVIEFADYRGEGATYLSSAPSGSRPLCVVRLHTPLSVLNKYNRRNVRYPVLETFEDQAVLLADRIVSPSQALAREYRERLPGLGEVALSPHPVDARFLDGDEQVDAKRTEVLYVGRLEERKGVEALIQAAPAFLDACPQAALQLVGGDCQSGPGIPSMRAHLQGLLPARYRQRVEFHDSMPRELLRRRYARARMCVFPSLFDNFPNTCLEAMALARPVIGTDNSGMAEMIEHGVSGVIVRAGDVEQLSSAMVDLYRRCDSEHRAMGAAARQRVRDAYHPDRVAEQFESLLGAGYAPRPRGSAHATLSDHPKVAVVIPCFNHGAFVREAVASAQAQDWAPLEWVVVDDGSTDEQTLRVLAELQREGVRVLRQENQGLAAARNTGVRATDAPFFVPLDADDRLAPEFVSKLMPALLFDASLGFSYGQVVFFGAATGGWECPMYDPQRLLVENLSVATAVVRRAAFDLVGGYSPDMVHGFEDWDLWIALLAVGYHGRCLPEPLFYYRKHPQGRSMLAETQRHRAEMVHRMIEHHRPLFASMLAYSLAEKDGMFFRAHMDAWHLRESLVEQGGTAAVAGAVEDPLYRTLMAQAELDYIEGSRTWQTVQRLKRHPVYRAAARLRFGPGWDRVSPDEDACQRLARVKASRSFRLIQAIKRTPLHRWYARRKYGTCSDQAPLSAGHRKGKRPPEP